MLLHGRKYYDEAGMGTLTNPFQSSVDLSDLSNTAVGGYTAGGSHGGRGGPILRHDLYIADHSDQDWARVPEIANALDELGNAYAFFFEVSQAPFQDAFIRRCRFITRDRFQSFHPRLDALDETTQPRSASATLSAFVAVRPTWPSLRAVYGDYHDCPDFRGMYGDDECFDADFVLWLEQPGVLRAWTRMIYLPK